MKKARVLDFVSYSSTNVPPAKTGTWRRVTPSFQNRVSPCTDFCPCGENIPVWMDLVAKRKFEAAWRELTKENPFPLICGRVCYRFCEKECNRTTFDDRLSINAVERFLGEYAAMHDLHPLISTDPALGKVTVAVIGGGPAGLSAAHFLARAGCSVALFDEGDELGGVLRYGIPQYRMPKDLLRKEIATMVTGLGVRVFPYCHANKEFLAFARREYNYIVVALGAHQERKLFGVDYNDRLTEGGLRFLSKISSGKLSRLPERMKHVCVVGGGNTAIDVSRSALRLGAEKVTVIYRRTENEMPAHRDEVEVAKREGVEFVFLTAPVAVAREESGRIVIGCVRMELGEADESGRRSVSEVDGSAHQIGCDLTISAIGEDSDVDAMFPETYHFETEEDVYDGKVICVGDALYGPRSVSEAVASGKKAAQVIIGKATGTSRDVVPREVVGTKEIKFYYLNKRRKDPRILNEKKLCPAEFRSFAETTRTISQEMAAMEASRCINCGTCVACDRCRNFCPDYAITQGADGKYSIDLDYCKGCGLCAEVCERSAILFGKEGIHVQE
ncbi:MAG TPA: FAD-dependent oxidoreductase [Candidatus Paceibacterota bacterium]